MVVLLQLLLLLYSLLLLIPLPLQAYKREVYYLQSTIKERDSELEIKEQKIMDVTKAKKRAVSKAKKIEDALEGVL